MSDLFTIQGQAISLQSGRAEPFNLVFAVAQPELVSPSLYQTSEPLIGFTLDIGGQAVYSAPYGEFWANSLGGSLYEGGLQIVQPGFDFSWQYQTGAPASNQLLSDLLSEGYGSNSGGVNGQWFLTGFQVSVVDPPDAPAAAAASVPAPHDALAVGLWAALAAAMLGARRLAQRLQEFRS
jgi:hypothetical protein